MGTPEDAEEILKHNIGRAIQAARRARNLTREDLAEHLKLTPNFVGEIERGHTFPSIANLQQIASVLGISADDIIYGRTEYPLDYEPAPMPRLDHEPAPMPRLDHERQQVLDLIQGLPPHYHAIFLHILAALNQTGDADSG